jgi:putative ABC transport system permease protein
MDTLWQDLRYALLQLRRTPGFTAVAVLTLALGIGANTAIFSVVNSVLLRPLPYRQPDRLVSIDLDALDYGGSYLQLRERARTMDVAAYRPAAYGSVGLSLTGSGEPVQLQGTAITSNLFGLLGVDAAIGRTFLPSESQPGRDAVVVLSYELWQARFGGDPSIVGSQIRLGSTSRTVVGVMPPHLHFPSATTQLWVPMVLDPANRTELWSIGANMIGRLRPGVELARARAEVSNLAPQMLRLFPWSMPAEYGREATAVPLRDMVVGSVRPMLLVLLGAVAMVLLMACVNVMNLLLVRTAARRRELAIRTALGAGRRRLMRQLLTESVLLAGIGGAAGLLLASWGVRAVTGLLPPGTPRLDEISIDGGVLAVTLAVALATGLVLGVVPAFRAARSEAQTVLKEGGRGSSAGRERRRLSGVLVISELALAVVLATGAGLLVRSFWRLLQTDPGFRTEQLVSASIAPPTFRYSDDVSQREFYKALLLRLETIPGVRMSAITTRLPFGGNSYGSVFKIDGRPNPAQTGDWPFADIGAVVSSEYFRTLSVPLLRGRAFTEADREGALPVVVINESLAHHYWPDQDPIGKRIQQPGDTTWATIVGIVADVKHEKLSEGTKGAIFWPLLQHHVDHPSIVVRTDASPDAVAASLRGAVADVDADTPVSDIRTMDQLISSSLSQPRTAMTLLAAFGMLALVLGAVGIYGVIAYAVSQRTHEIGVRIALGARPGDMIRMVIEQGGILAFIGIVVGLVGAFALTRLLAALLYGVSPLDPATFITAPIVLMCVALLATSLPARRAARVDPVVALREE